MNELPGFEGLRSARTARTYPVRVDALARAVETAIRKLPRWVVSRSTEGEIRATRRARLGPKYEVKIRLIPLESGDHTNTLAKFESRSRAFLWSLGRNKRNLNELTGGIDEHLKPK